MLVEDEGKDQGDVSTRVCVIGGGAGGLCMGAQLQAAGITDFLIVEKSDGVGGTWRDNSYPGSGCDIPSHLYTFSFAPNSSWSRKWAKQPEILEYFESLVDRFELGGRLRTNTEITEVVWSDSSSEWTLMTAAGTTITADFVVSALGQLNVPNYPAVPGMETFSGTSFHSARWDSTHDLDGERVAVIGIGASAIQFVPQVAKKAAELVLFQRSPNHVGPKADREFKPWERWAFEHVPGVGKAYRDYLYWKFETRFGLMMKDSWLGEFAQKQFNKKIQPMVSEDLPAEALVPEYRIGCKRVLIANDWYPTLMRPNVRLTTTGVSEIDATGIVTDAGEHVDLDTIIYGTGFQTTDFLTPMKVTGSQGTDLNETWDNTPVAYLGLSVEKFPNFFMLYGPNTNLGHNSILFMIEQQVGFVLSAISEMDRRNAAAIDVSEGAMTRWDAEIVRRSADTVWAGDCHSWYKTADGRVTNNWVGHTTEYRKRLANPRWTDWAFKARNSADENAGIVLA